MSDTPSPAPTLAPTPLADFLLPPGFARPGLVAVAREGRVVAEAGRYVSRVVEERTRRLTGAPARRRGTGTDPVVLVPGFMAGDTSLALMSAELRQRGYRTYRAGIHANIGCTMEAALKVEERLESIVARRGVRAQIVGHSLGGMIARGIAVRRPDLVSGIVTMGSPMLAPGAHHAALSCSVVALTRLSRLGVPGLMSRDCVAGQCARESWLESREPLADDVAFTALYSRRDGVVDWRACVDPVAVPVEVTTSHLGMAVDPRVVDEVSAALRVGVDSVAGRRRGLRIA